MFEEYVFSKESSSDNTYYTSTDYSNWSISNMENYFDISIKKYTLNDISLDDVLEILFHVTPSDILNFSKTNKEYHELCQDDVLWNHFILKKYSNRKEIFDRIIYNNKKELYFIIHELEKFFKYNTINKSDKDLEKEFMKHYDCLGFINVDSNNLFKELRYTTLEHCHLPNSIFKLKSVIACNSLYFNSFQLHKIPSNIFMLEHLVELSIMGCNISYIPHSIHKLFNLKLLNLMDNKLDHFSVNIIRIPNLRYLYLRNNNIDMIPDEVENMKHLLFLDISKNNFLIFPNNLAKLAKLKCLVIYGNLFGTFSNKDIENIKLSFLNLTCLYANYMSVNIIYFNVYRFDEIVEFKVDKHDDKIITMAISESGCVFTRELNNDDCFEYFKLNVDKVYEVLNDNHSITFYRTKKWLEVKGNNRMIYQMPLIKIN